MSDDFDRLQPSSRRRGRPPTYLRNAEIGAYAYSILQRLSWDEQTPVHDGVWEDTGSKYGRRDDVIEHVAELYGVSFSTVRRRLEEYQGAVKRANEDESTY